MSLKVFDLQCGRGHVFEGWFSSDSGFESQSEQGLLNCPICGDAEIARKLSAPRLNLGKRSSEAGSASHAGDRGQGQGGEAAVMAPSSPQLARFQAELMRHMREVVKSSEDVGDRFAQEALKIHHGDAKERAIRGTATFEERRQLSEEGVSVMPVPDFLDDDQFH